MEETSSTYFAKSGTHGSLSCVDLPCSDSERRAFLTTPPEQNHYLSGLTKKFIVETGDKRNEAMSSSFAAGKNSTNVKWKQSSLQSGAVLLTTWIQLPSFFFGSPSRNPVDLALRQFQVFQLLGPNIQLINSYYYFESMTISRNFLLGLYTVYRDSCW